MTGKRGAGAPHARRQLAGASSAAISEAVATLRNNAARDRQSLVDALARVGAGDARALGEVYDRTAAKLFGICLRILGDHAEAEDALQEVYVAVWHGAARFAPERASPITWLATLARNRAIDRLRASGRPRAAALGEEALTVADDSPDAFDRLETSEECSRLLRCLGELDPRAGMAIRAAFFDGQTYPMQAAASGTPLGTVKSWVRRGLARLKVCLER